MGSVPFRNATASPVFGLSTKPRIGFGPGRAASASPGGLTLNSLCGALCPAGEPPRELGPRPDAELRVRARQVHLDRVHGHDELPGDLLVRAP